MVLKKYICFSVLCLIMISSAYALPKDAEIYVRNTHASYVNRGMCSLAFDVIAYDALDNIESIDFTVTMKDKNGKLIGRDQVTADEFNFVGGKTYGRFFIEGEKACNAFGENLNIIKAIVKHNDGTKAEDIVKTQKLKVDDFKPMKIVIGGK
ncbi:hypothetical protein I1W56_01210 [Acinetobacter baumannii]|uniref:hypothetical protein n=1 Tax=Acinetobacter baumannii TaxID=470 RepID=UPI0018A748F4|nr:hypothetical protein [Acinetobacter baumannii]MBF8313627.1 hypothetical protein [Acinetobacter baumannii]HCQ9810147.1 hypothetical protein [Acinetobacter baumannii]